MRRPRRQQGTDRPRPTSASPPPSTPMSGSASSETPSTPSAAPSTIPDIRTATAADTQVSAAVAVNYCRQPGQKPRYMKLYAAEIH
ncbi:predicted protein [Streptomyces albidoflavus]|nr:predicted protein [Streptomyces albidoflavus]